MLFFQVMSEIDLLNAARSSNDTITNEFAQIITITFAMIVAIYYFLYRADWRMKTFALFVYTCGMLTYFFMMVMESSVSVGAQEALRAIPEAARSGPTASFLGVRASWLGTVETSLLNLSFLVLWLGTSYLLFFWSNPHQTVRETP